jgi:hypothetical protein
VDDRELPVAMVARCNDRRVESVPLNLS